MATGYVYPARVVAMDPEGPIVMVPLLAQSARWGPLPSTVADLDVGEQVIVTSLGTSRDQLVIIGRLPGRVPTLDEIPGLDARLDAIEAVDTTQNGRLTTVETKNSQQDTRLTGVEGVNTTQDGRLTAVEGRATSIEGVNTTQNNRLTAVEGANTTQDGRLTAVEGVNATQTSRLDGIDTLNTTQNNRLTATEGVANAAATTASVTTLRADTAGKATAKGDLLVATASGVLARQAVGADGLALVGAAAQANGVAYAEIRGLPVGGTGLTGAANATRYAGSTGGGAPTTGTFAVGDFVLDRVSGDVWVCTAAGTPGTWISPTGRERVARTTANTTFTNTTAYANIGGLSFSVEANAEYILDGLLHYNALQAADVKFNMTAPTGTLIQFGLFGAITSLVATDATTTQGATEFYMQNVLDANGRGLGANGNVSIGATPKGWLLVGGTAGTLQLQGAQLTANATASTLQRGSWLRLIRIA